MSDLPCPNCKETEDPCACMRNKCLCCGEPVGNITFTCCDECWDATMSKNVVDKQERDRKRLEMWDELIKFVREYGLYPGHPWNDPYVCEAKAKSILARAKEIDGKPEEKE